LASARAIAAKEQRYAGIRFQKRYDPNNPDPLKASQYIIFVVHDPTLTGTYGFGFRAVEGIQPIKLPDSIGVMDFFVVSDRNRPNPINPNSQTIITTNADIDEYRELLDTTTFSIIFSPAGKLVVHGVCAWNRDGGSGNSSHDDIFNTVLNVETNRIAMFYQDDWADPSAFGPEPSRNSFIIYETKKFKQAYNNGNAYSGYLSLLNRFYINQYTGTIINEK
jgi:hypothetical protein